MADGKPVPATSEGVLGEHHSPAVNAGTGKTAEREGAQAKKVHNAELFAAVRETKIKKWSKESLQLYCSLMTGVIAMGHFQNTFHTGTTGTQVSIIFSLYTVGSMIAAPVAAIISEKFRRRKAMFSGAIVIIVGAIIVSTSNTLAQFVVGRFVLGMGIQVMTVAAPAYAVEISPPHWRGRCTGFYNTGWVGGSIPAAAITFGCNAIDNNYQWRIPLIFQCFACIVVLGAVFFIPESPRWLIANGNESVAMDFLVKYHGNGDVNSRLVLLELEEMRDGIRQDGVDKTKFNFLMISIFGQFSGNGLGYVNTVIFEQLGITSSSQHLGYNLLNSVLSAIGAWTAVSLTDRMPRRKVLVIGTFVCACALAVNSGLSAALNAQGDNVSTSYAQGGLAAYFLFNIIFSFTYTPPQAVVVTEALETTTRAKGLAASGVIVSAMGFINQFAGPIALGDIGYRYIYVSVGWDLFESIMWYFFGVEAQGRTLEQLEWVYNQLNPVKASLKVDKIIVQADGKVTEKVVDGANV
ncbi:putative Lactose permease [Seiridium cardinale]